MKTRVLFSSLVVAMTFLGQPFTASADDATQSYKIRVRCSGAEGTADGSVSIALARGSHDLSFNGVVAKFSETGTPLRMYLSARDGVAGYEVELAELYFERDGRYDGMNASQVLFSHENGFSLGRYDAVNGNINCSIKIAKSR